MVMRRKGESRAVRLTWRTKRVDWDMEGLDPLLFSHGEPASTVEEELTRWWYLQLKAQLDKLDAVRRDVSTRSSLLTEPYLLATCADGRLPTLIVVIKLWPHLPSASFVLPIDDLLAANLADKINKAYPSWLAESSQPVYLWNDSIPPSQVGLGHLPWTYPTDGEVLSD